MSQGSMYMNNLLFLQAGTQGSVFMPILTFGLVFVIFYLFIIRPQNKKQKETERMISAVKKGDKVVTIGGIHGEVTSTKEQTVIIKVDDSCKIEFSRSGIASVVKDEKEDRFSRKGKKAVSDESESK